MSVFKLSEIAPWLGKDERTLRRWCIAGRVEGAFQTAGGHWRIRAKHPRKVRVDFEGFRPRARGLFKKANDTLRRVRVFHSRGRGRAFLRSADSLVDRLGQMDYTEDQRELVRERLNAVMDTIPTPETMEAVIGVATRVWEWESDRIGLRGEMGVARVAGIARTTFRLHFSRYLNRCVDAEPEPERCEYPEHATDQEMRLWGSGRARFTEHRDAEDADRFD
jgi:hypothetical protein